MLLRTMSHFDLDRKVPCHMHHVVGLRSLEVEQECYANPQLLMTNRQSALGHFSIGRVGQFSISANSTPSLRGWIGVLCSAGWDHTTIQGGPLSFV